MLNWDGARYRFYREHKRSGRIFPSRFYDTKEEALIAREHWKETGVELTQGEVKKRMLSWLDRTSS